MKGRSLMIGLLGFTALFAGGLYYAQFYAFYDVLSADSVAVAGREMPVTGFQGIDASTSPLKLRACFTLAEVPEAPAYPRAEPLVAPGWFDCFDAGTLTADLAAGRATAFLAEAEEFEGADRVILRYPDGRAFMWRQLTAEFADQ
ncbi:MAG: DUF6446 family protein [Pseudomonadota bacterium]